MMAPAAQVMWLYSGRSSEKTIADDRWHNSAGVPVADESSHPL